MQATLGLHRRKSIARADEYRQREPTLRRQWAARLGAARPSMIPALPGPKTRRSLRLISWSGTATGAVAGVGLAGAGVLAGVGFDRFDHRCRCLLDHRARQRFQLRLGQ